ncbi:MAG TPA: response regulator [Chloroflexia bacterium]|nr:response regulator [Chloroflexia bacterium]
MDARILVIDDSAALLELLDEILTEDGYRVTTWAQPLPTLEPIKQLAPDLVILDYLLGAQMEGPHLWQQLRADPATAHIPLILCTAAVQEVQSLAAELQQHQVAVVYKPFELEELLATVLDQLAARGARL